MSRHEGHTTSTAARPARAILCAALLLAVSGPVMAAPPTDGWRIRFDARMTGLVDQGRLTLGASTQSGDGADDFDDPHPPALPSRFLDLFTEHLNDEPGWEAQFEPSQRYRAQYDSVVGPRHRTIGFFLETDQAGPVTFTWALSPDVDLAQHHLTLRDSSTGADIDMWAQSTYAFTASASRRAFQVELVASRSAPPIAQSQAVSTPEDTLLPVTLSALDPEGEPLTFSVASAPSHGTLVGSAPNLTYHPARDYFGPDAFTFTARDATANSNLATVSIDVLPVNDAPVAQAQSIATDEDTPAALTLTGTDVEGDPLGFAVVTGPAHGSLSGSGATLTYVPAADYFGADSFTFRANDGAADSAPAAVTVTVRPVEDPPIAAFTVPGAERNAATWENNVGSFHEGASVLAFSSQNSTSLVPGNMIDDNVSSRWTSATGQIAGQFVTVALPGARSQTISVIRIVNADGTGGQAIKRFEVRVSNTTADDAAFTTVLSDSAFDNNRVQEFPLPSPVSARYVKLVAIDNWGSACCVSVKSFEVIAPGLAGVASHFVLPANAALLSELGRIAAFSSQNGTNFRPENAIDGNNASRWASASGARTNQSIVVELGRGKTYQVDRVRLVNAANTGGQSVKNFRIDVSSTTTEESAFQTALTAVALDNSSVQEFVFPGGAIDARYVRLFAIDNYSLSACCVAVSELQVVPVPATATSYSGYQDASSRPEMLLDNAPGTSWLSPSGQVTNQFVELDLGRETLVDRVRLQPAVFAAADAARDFEVLLSSTTDADPAFTRVLTGTVANNAQLQEFVLPAGPVRARFARLVVKNNHGSGSFIRLSTFEVVAVRSEGNVVTLPAPPPNVAHLQSPSLVANGATVVAVSSSFDVNHTPVNMLDYLAGNPWATRGLTGQFATIQLGGTGLHSLTGVKVSPRLDCCTDQSVKAFEVWVSSTTTADADFTKVLTGTVLNDGTLQTFPSPGGVQARYVKYVPLSNYGNATSISTSNFEVIAAGAGGVVSATTQTSFATRPEFTLDGSTSTVWRSKSGSVTNQSITLTLAGGASHPLYGVAVYPEGGFGPKDYEIQVSNTTADDAAFATVATGTLTNLDARRAIPFTSLIPATHVRFLWKTGLSTSFIGVRELEALEAPATGAVVVAASSEANSTTLAAARALDVDRTLTGWVTASGQNTNQSLKVLLPRGDAWLVDHVALQPRAECCADQSPRDFEVQVSATTWDDAAFTTVLAGTLRNDSSLQHFDIPPVAARAVRLLLKNGYGGTQLGLHTFWVFSPQLGGTAARFLDRSRAVDGALAGYQWDFGDGGSSADRDPVHAFSGPGVYDVTLTVTDANGLSSTRTHSYQVFGSAQPSFTFTPAVPNEGQFATFTDTSADAFGIGYREWVWGDATANVVNQTPASHAFADNGSYGVTLRVTNNRGLTSEATRAVAVANLPPTVDAGPNQSLVWGQSWSVSSIVSDPSSVDRTSLVCTWDFGDQQTTQVTNCTSSNVRVPHAYANPGTYTATLTVQDKEDATAFDTLTVTVAKRPTLLNIYAALGSTPAGEVDVAVKLVDRFEVPRAMAGQAVVFTMGAQTATAMTNAEGIATARLSFAPGVINTVSVSYAGDGFHLSSTDTDSFNPVIVFPETPSLRNEQSELVALVPSEMGRFANGGVLSTVGFSAGYAPLILVVDPLVVADGTKANPLPAFDSVVLNGICDIGSNAFLGSATFRGRIQEFVTRGGKLVIWDSECTNTDYSKFFLPFTTNNPGARGAQGTLQIVEENTLSSNDPASPAFIDVTKISTQTDAVGDSNVFLTFDPNWCVDMTARNAVLSEFKPVHTYALLGRGLLIYNGLDRDFMVSNAASNPGTGSFYLAKIWERELKQPWNPSGLPCDVAATEASIALAPTAATLDAGQAHTLTTTVTNTSGVPLRSVFVTLSVTGAHTLTQQSTTNDIGVATFSYTGTTVGDDVLVARAGAIQSNAGSAHWNGAPNADAGDDQTVGTGSTVTLDGSRSSDPNPGDVLTYAWRQVSGPAVTLEDAASARPRFTPAEAEDHGFELRVGDGRLSDTDTVTVTAEVRNRPPVASNQTVTTDEDTPVAIALGVSDPDGDVLTFTILSAPTHGVLSGVAPNLTYTPAADYSGPDAFTFKVNDGLVDSNVATVSITVRPVNDPPVAASQSVTTDEDTPVAITLTGSDVDGDALAYAVAAGPTHGSLSGTAPDRTYTPAADYNGSDSFTFTVNDGQADSNVGTVSITVRPVNDAPGAANQSVTTHEDTAVGITLTGSDVEGDALAYTVVGAPAHGTLSGTAPSLTYTPAADYNGPDALTFEVNDGQADSNVATVSITVRPVNDRPVARDESVATDEDVAVAATLRAHDVDGDALTYTVIASPAHGTLSGTAPNLTYTPAADSNGPDSFTFKVNDGSVDSNVATVRITVRPVNDAPVCTASRAVPERLLWPPNHTFDSLEIVGVTDVEGDLITIRATAIRQDEAVLEAGSGNTDPDGILQPLQVRSERSGGGDGRIYHITFEGADGQGGTCTATVAVCVPHDRDGRSDCIDGGPLYDSTRP